jgi:Asp-tRNA(Asn)/Glu-tRNA(Gln) amidotransferase B subunit
MGLTEVASQVVAESPQAEQDYNSGNQEAMNYLVDEVMRRTHGTYHAAAVRAELKQHLSNKQ